MNSALHLVGSADIGLLVGAMASFDTLGRM
jgi:hypothetical protein